MKKLVPVAAPDAVEVADAPRHSTVATEVSHAAAPISHPAERLSVIPPSRQASAPIADPDRGTPGLNCQGFGGPGKINVMCAPQ